MDVLPLAVTQIQLLLWGGRKHKEEAQNNYNIRLLISKLENANHHVNVLLFLIWNTKLVVPEGLEYVLKTSWIVIDQ